MYDSLKTLCPLRLQEPFSLKQIQEVLILGMHQFIGWFIIGLLDSLLAQWRYQLMFVQVFYEIIVHLGADTRVASHSQVSSTRSCVAA